MKTVAMARDFPYRVKVTVVIMYLGGVTYQRVPEAAVRAILEARAGIVIDQEDQDCPIPR